MAYDRLDPIGDERADLNAGIVAAMIANANRDTSARPEPYSPLECMATYDGAPVRREPSAVVLGKLKAGLRLAKAELERKEKGKAKG